MKPCFWAIDKTVGALGRTVDILDKKHRFTPLNAPRARATR
jgi:hypothetical protein